MWSGWQELEDWSGGRVVQRWVFGRGLDEILSAEIDLTGDGFLESVYLPFYDGTGSVVRLTDLSGQLVGAAEYSPFGEDRRWTVSTGPPEVGQIRIEQDAVVIEFSKELPRETLEQSVGGGRVRLEIVTADPGASTSPGTGPSSVTSLAAATIEPVSMVASRPVQQGRHARKRLVLTPEVPPAVGDEVVLTLEASALLDLFLQPASTGYTLSFTWPESSASPVILEDTAAPQVTLVVRHEGRLVIQLSETPDLTTVPAAILVDGAP